MTKQQKTETIEQLKEKFSNQEYFYVADSSALTVEQINQFRRRCFAEGIEVRVVKNTLARIALEQAPEEKGFGPLLEAFKGTSAVLFSDVSNSPAKVIMEFRKEYPRPILKAAYIDSAVFLGDEQLESLVKLKSKSELIGDILFLLQSPAMQVISALQSGGNILGGLLKALEERENAA